MKKNIHADLYTRNTTSTKRRLQGSITGQCDNRCTSSQWNRGVSVPMVVVVHIPMSNNTPKARVSIIFYKTQTECL